MAPRLRVTVPVVFALALTACSGSDEGADVATTTEGSLPGASAVTTVPGGDVTTTSPPPDSSVATTAVPTLLPSESTSLPSTTVAEVDDGGDCLVGSWVVTAEQMNAYYAGLMTTVDAPITITATGQAGLVFEANGTYAWAPDLDLVVDVVGAPGVGETSGSVTGSWTAADATLVTASDVNELQLSITVNGTTFNGSDLANGLLSQSPVSGVTYSCAGPTPVIDFKTADPEVTVPVTLTPA